MKESQKRANRGRNIVLAYYRAHGSAYPAFDLKAIKQDTVGRIFVDLISLADADALDPLWAHDWAVRQVEEVRLQEDLQQREDSEKAQENAYRERAVSRFAKDGKVEFDKEATVSIGEDGAYVQAWLFVPKEKL